MIEDKIHDYLQIPFMALFYEGGIIFSFPEYRINLPVIRHIVAKIEHGRSVNRREPDSVNTEACYVIEPGDNSRNVAYTVTAGVVKTSRIYLINNTVLPPYFFSGII